jgi:hypothetical protein
MTLEDTFYPFRNTTRPRKIACGGHATIAKPAPTAIASVHLRILSVKFIMGP